MAAPSYSPHPDAFIEFRPPDLLWMRMGAASMGGVERISEVFRERGEQSPFYLVVDFTHMKGGIDAATREGASRLVRPEWLLGCVFINASMGMRLSIKAITLGMFLVGKADYPSEFVTSEAEALEAIERFRKEKAAWPHR